MDPLEQIKASSGQKLYTFMRLCDKKIKHEDSDPRLKIWFKACSERAKEINRLRFGNWEEAKSKLDQLQEPKTEKENYYQKRIAINLDLVNGYPCQFVREKTEDGIKSFVFITNGKKNLMYMKDFGGVSYKKAKEIFN